MKEIFIKYNPFTLNTEIKVDGENYSKISNFSFNKKKRLQEWVDNIDRFIENLDDEFNYNGGYYIKFHGTKPDYEDLTEAIKKLENREIQLEYIESKEIADRKNETQKIFYEIQNNSYGLENLKSKDLRKKFEEILNSEFEINVVATMSSGKSTLINSLLSKKILPSSNEACTATITRIKDTDNSIFFGKAYSEKGELKYEEYDISYEKMKEWNDDDEISTIKIEGEIPFVKANEISLVITDTPGPNYSENKSHEERLTNMLDSNKYKPLILYVLNGRQLGIRDDSKLLNQVIAKLKNADKQTRDSFLFVVNQLDTFDKTNDNMIKTLEKTKKYLEEKGIVEPNIFPVAALPALEIRCEPQSMEEKMDRDYNISRMNIYEHLHLEKYSLLPPKDKREIESELKLAVENEDNEKEALIHTGIPSLEKIIKAYIEKYAMAIKIKDMVDSFKGIVYDELNSNQFEEEINKIRNDENKVLELKNQIDNINNEIFKLEKVDEYNNEVTKSSEKEAENLKEKIRETKEKLVSKVQTYAHVLRISNLEKIEMRQAEKLYTEMIKFREEIERNLRNDLRHIIQNGLIGTLKTLYDEYVDKLKKVTGNKIIGEDNLIVNPFEMIEGNIESFRSFDEFKSEYSEIKSEFVGTKEVKNNKEWWEFWRWLEPATKIIDVYEDVEYVGINEFADTYVTPIETIIRTIIDNAIEHSEKEILKIQKGFIDTKEQLDNILQDKLNSISKLLQNKETTTEDIKIKSEMYTKKIEWLKNIKNRIENVIEI
ncbi:dynamin family protein [Leptotrichia massiliensis]